MVLKICTMDAAFLRCIDEDTGSGSKGLLSSSSNSWNPVSDLCSSFGEEDREILTDVSIESENAAVISLSLEIVAGRGLVMGGIEPACE